MTELGFPAWDGLRWATGRWLQVFDWTMLLFLVAANTFYTLMLILSAFGLRQFLKSSRHELLSVLRQSDILPPITILVPAYNEEQTIAESVRSMLAQNYPRLEIVVVNDGSSDRTIDELRRAFKLHPVIPLYLDHIPTRPVQAIYRSKSVPNLIVADKENGGKSDALNCAINLSSSPLLCAVDADTLIEDQALLRMIRPFLTAPDRVAAVGGTIRVSNGCQVETGRVAQVALSRSWAVRFQVVEYIRSFLFGRLGWNPLGGPLIISGAFGLFRRDLVLQAGGYRRGTVGEDMDLALSLHDLPRTDGGRHRIVYVPDSACWTQVPEDWTTLGRQRMRWQRGLCESMLQHHRMFFSRRLGAIGLVGIPLTFFGEVLAPVTEVLGYAGVAAGYGLGVVDAPFALLFVLVAWGYGTLLSGLSIVLEEISFHRYRFRDMAALFLAASLEGFGYRQINLWWRVKGFIQFLSGRKDWGLMRRQAFSTTLL